MKNIPKIALTLCAGASVGALAVQTLHAQAKPPVYMIAINEVSNPDGYKKNTSRPLGNQSRTMAAYTSRRAQKRRLPAIFPTAALSFCGGRAWISC